MNDPIETLLKLGDQAPRLYCICTGAGASLQDKIWAVPGISNFFVGAQMPYEMQETSRILGFTPEKFVSPETAVDLAQAAYLRAYQVGKSVIGLGMTCSVASTREHRGDHRIICAVQTNDTCLLINALIPKGVGIEQRRQDGELADQIALHLLSLVLSDPEQTIDCTELPRWETIDAQDLARSRILVHPYFRNDGTRGTATDITATETIFYPGAFNPPHEGHFKGSQAALQCLLQQALTPGLVSYRLPKLVFSTTVDPPHKAALTVTEMLQRVAQLRGHNFLLTEGDPLYLDKAKRWPGAKFILGADALDRMMDPVWGVEPSYLLDQFKRFNTKFLVLGRLVDGCYMSYADIKRKHASVMMETREGGSIFNAVPFRLDLSSSELRKKA